MTDSNIFPQLEIPNTLAAGPGPGNTDARVLARFASAGIADHMHETVLRGMVECKFMLRDLFGTKNIHTFGVAGTGWSGLDCMFSAVMPGDTVVAFSNGTFSGIDALTIRMKAATREVLAKDSLNPTAASVTVIEIPHGQSVTRDMVEAALKEHKPKLVILELGGNDGLRGMSIKKVIKKNLDEMIRMSLDEGSKVALIGVELPPNYGARYTDNFKNMYVDLANQYNLTLVQGSIKEMVSLSLMQADGIHPNIKGHIQIEEDVRSKILSLLH